MYFNNLEECLKQMNQNCLSIVMRDEDGDFFDITNNLYWFEENGIRGIDNLEGYHGDKYELMLFWNGRKITFYDDLIVLEDKQKG